MITRPFNSAPARFAVYIYAKNGLEIFTQQSKNISHCIRSLAPQCCDVIQIIKCPSNYLHRSTCVYQNNTRRCSSDVVQFPKFSSKCFIDLTPSKNILSLIETNSNAVLFRQLNSKSSGSPYLLQTNKNTLEYLKGLPKSFWFRQRNNDGKKPKRRIPKLILLQNPFTWLMIKIDFGVLRSLWDPSFTEKDFKYGTKQAISKVTDVISQGQFSDLNGLLTKAARLSLMRELDRNWSEKQRSLLALKLEDIQISSPRKVYFIRIADKKYCDVDMAFLALKWAPINSIEALIFTEIFARFHREYTPHCIPEWTIAYFKVTRFEVLRKKAKIT